MGLREEEDELVGSETPPGLNSREKKKLCKRMRSTEEFEVEEKGWFEVSSENF